MLMPLAVTVVLQVAACGFFVSPTVNPARETVANILPTFEPLSCPLRYRAQLQLKAFGRYTRQTTVKNLCTATG